MNQSMAENFMRSAKAPAISAGVMIAKVIWKHMYTVSGIVAASGFGFPAPVGDVAEHALQEQTTKPADVG